MRDESPGGLVVEDTRDTSALLRDLLEAEGYQVSSVATSADLLDHEARGRVGEGPAGDDRRKASGRAPGDEDLEIVGSAELGNQGLVRLRIGERRQHALGQPLASVLAGNQILDGLAQLLPEEAADPGLRPAAAADPRAGLGRDHDERVAETHGLAVSDGLHAPSDRDQDVLGGAATRGRDHQEWLPPESGGGTIRGGAAAFCMEGGPGGGPLRFSD